MRTPERCNISPRRAAPTSHLRSRHGGGRGGEAAAPAHSTPVRVGGSAAHRDERHRRLGGPAARPGGRVKKLRGHRLAAPAGRPRAARQPPPRKWRGERRVPIGLFELHGRRSGGLRQRSGGMPARVLVPIAAVRSGGAIGVGRTAAAWQADGEATCGAQSAPGGRFPRRLLTGRAAWARYSARTRERRGERANWPPLTRPTVRGLAVVWSSTHAAGQKFRRAARRSGTSWRRPSTTGHWAPVGAFGAL